MKHLYIKVNFQYPHRASLSIIAPLPLHYQFTVSSRIGLTILFVPFSSARNKDDLSDWGHLHVRSIRERTENRAVSLKY